MINSSDKNKTCAVIPFFNEAKSLKEVIDKVGAKVDYIICIDDGSTDGSAEITNSFNNLLLLTNDCNRGKGYSLRIGLNKAVELGFKKIITIDADLQHDPEYIPGFLKYLGEFDIVIGNRLDDLKDMPVHRVMSNKITSFLLSIRFKQNILDSQCGYRAFNAAVIRDILPGSNGFEAETEMIIKALRQKIKIGFISVPTIYGEERSKMRNWEATIGFLKVYFSRR